jgi:hypothetical protein
VLGVIPKASMPKILWSGQKKSYENKKNGKMTTHLTLKTKKGAYPPHIYMKITDTKVLEAKKASSCRLIMGGGHHVCLLQLYG